MAEVSLFLAINFHIEVTTRNHTDADAWTQLQSWIDQFCTPQHILNYPTKQAASLSLEGRVSKKKAEKSARISILKAAHTTNVLENTSVHNVAYKNMGNIHVPKLFNEN